MLLHFLKPILDVGKVVDHHRAAAAMMVLPGSWIEAFVGAVKVYEKKTAAQAKPTTNLSWFLFCFLWGSLRRC